MSLLDCDWTKDAIISDLCKAFLPKFTILAESFYISGSSVQLCPIPAPYICASFVSSVIASAGYVFNIGTTPEIALGTSVLYLVPGVPYLNSMSDLLDGHYISFLNRFLDAMVLTACLSAGLCGGFLVMNLRWF